MSKAAEEKTADGGEVAAKGGKKKLLLVALVLVIAVGAGAWFFVLPHGSAEAEEPVAGAILALDPVAVNLAGGGYLKIGVALQLTAEVEAEPDGTKANDLVISHFSQADAGEVHSAREALKEALVAKIVEAYDGAVMDVYYLEYVTQ